MKKLILILFLFTGLIHAQDESKNPDQIVFDRYGNSYRNSDLQAMPSQAECSAGYFNLNFTDNSDLGDPSNSVQMNRRNVICQVFRDLSNFINSPLSQNGQIRILFTDIDAMAPSHNGLLGAASGVYTDPVSLTKGGITDNEIWKSLKTGSISSVFYKGIMAFNFKTDNSPAIIWNTNMSITSPVGSYDLYSVVLHEVLHLLGFNSLLNQNGDSTLSNSLKYYSRYDSFLRSNDLSNAVITNGGLQPSTMYNFEFNTNNNHNILYPGCANPSHTANGSSNSTTCSSAIRYFGTSNIPVYTPVCFEPGSSLSHFEDQCYTAPPGFPSGNDSYFVMSNAQSNGSPPSNSINTKRSLTVEEKNVLCDIGYSLRADFTFGIGTTSQIITNLGIACAGIVVSGVNDGVNGDTYTFIGDAGTDIPINGILSNDIQATSFEGLEDFNDTTARFNTTLTSISGNASTTVNFKSNVLGEHLLRYVPVNGTQKGNITYIKVFVRRVTNCQLPSSSCEFVINGGFEENFGIPTGISQFDKVCGWDPLCGTATPDYFHTTAGVGNSVAIPCNSFGNESSSNQGNNAYVGMFAIYYSQSSIYNETIKTKLRFPLQANTPYRLSFLVSLGEAASQRPMKFQALISSSNYSTISANYLPVSSSDILLNNTTFSTLANGWEVITMTFTTGQTAGQQYLYLGGINNTQYTVAPQSTFPSCSNIVSYNVQTTYYYIDNVSLVPEPLVALNLPPSVCQIEVLSNLNSYVSPFVVGTFSGLGVTGTTFNATTAGIGTKVISFTYSELGCSKTIYGNITVSDCSSSTCPSILLFNAPEVSTSTITYQASGTINANTNYIVSATTPSVIFKAGNSITFSSLTEIKASSTSNFTAKIESCSTAKISNKELARETKANDEEEKIYLFPNPSNEIITISTKNSYIKKITLFSIDGKMVYSKEIEKSNSFQLNIGNYQKGVYLAVIETQEGKVFREKIIKN